MVKFSKKTYPKEWPNFKNSPKTDKLTQNNGKRFGCSRLATFLLRLKLLDTLRPPRRRTLQKLRRGRNAQPRFGARALNWRRGRRHRHRSCGGVG